MRRSANPSLDLNIELIGFKALGEVLMEFPKLSTQRAVLRKAHAAWGKLTRTRMKLLAPKRTEPPRMKYGGKAVVPPGRLKDSITSRMSKKLTGTGGLKFDMVWLVYPWMTRKLGTKAAPKNAWYRHFVEFGFTHKPHFIKGQPGKYKPNKAGNITTVEVKARPFINKAFEDTVVQGQLIYKKVMADAMLHAAMKLRKKNPDHQFFGGKS